MCMKKNGFTLVELLAVIVILGLLSVIIVPKVTESIKNAQEKKFIVSANNLISIFNSIAIDKKANLEAFSGCSYNFETSATDCPEFSYSGVLPTSGTMSVDADGNVTCSLNYNGIIYSCVDNVVIVDNPVESEYLFDYVVDSNKEQSLVVPKSGYYKLEVWGAQGGKATNLQGGYGGYSTGVVYLIQGTELFINVGGQGSDSVAEVVKVNAGGYNGGGAGNVHRNYSGTSASGGGGATHIALKPGTLASFDADSDGVADSDEIEDILIVAGGGGGSHTDTDTHGYASLGGHGGGATGFNALQTGLCTSNCISYSYPSGGTQTSGGLGVTTWDTGSTSSSTYVGKFGLGATAFDSYGGGGGGFYGGASGQFNGGGGGSGYIGNSKLLDGAMYCYDCYEHGGDGEKTISTTGNNKDLISCPNGYSNDPVSHCAKGENGYAKVTYLGKQYVSNDIAPGTQIAFSYVAHEDREQVFSIPKTGYYKLEVWGAQGGKATNLQGGYGGYSSGFVKLTMGQILYINVGKQGSDSVAEVVKVNTGGYNGGGNGKVHRNYSGTSASGGGGATHIALKSGTLASFDADSDGVADSDEFGDILIVAGGGGGSYMDTDVSGYDSLGGHGGGATGSNALQTGLCTSDCISYSYPSGGTQTSGGLGVTTWDTGSTSSSTYVGKFGLGASGTNSYGGGGGGFYGGASGQYNGGGGGSGYIRNSKLLSGVMYCYDCTEDGNDGTRTISTTGSNRDTNNCPSNYSSSALSNCAKAGSGYAVITYIGESLN